MKNSISFNEHNYPKFYASINKNHYRLKDFSKLPEEILEQIESKFWDFIYKKANSTKPTKNYKNYDFLAAGWEWSVFKRDKHTLIKVPAQIFTEVSEFQYLKNTEFAYKKILAYFPKLFVARTKFQRLNGANIIQQELIKGDDSFLVDFQVRSQKLFIHLIRFLNSTLKMLSECEWLPDFNIKKIDNGFNLGNVVIEKDSFIPKIIDFTAYYDTYRLYKERKDYEVKEKAREIREFIRWLKTKQATLSS